MKRTTIFLPDEVHERLRAEAFEAHVSMAHLIRNRLEPRVRTRPSSADPLAKVEGIIKDGQLAKGIDEALYASD